MARNGLISDRSSLGDNCYNVGVNIEVNQRGSVWLPSCRGQNCGVQAMYGDGGHAMSLSRNGYAVSTRRGALGVLFSALLTVVLFDSAAARAAVAKQIKLTERHVQAFKDAVSG